MSEINIKDFLLSEETEQQTKKTPKQKLPAKYNVLIVDGPDIVIEKEMAKSKKYLVLLVNKQTYYIKDQKGKIDELTPSNLNNFLNDAPADGIHIDSLWLPCIRKGLAGCKRFISFLEDKTFYSLVKSNFITFRWVETETYSPMSYPDFEEVLMPTLKVALKYLTKEQVAEVCGCAFLRISPGYGETHVGYDATPMGREEIALLSILDEFMTLRLFYEQYGAGGMRDIVDAQLAMPVLPAPYSRSYGYRGITTYWFEYRYMRDLFWSSYLRKKRFFELKSLIKYLIFDRVREGYGNDPVGFVNEWIDTLNMQEMIRGKIYDKYPENLATMHKILSYKSELIKKDIDDQKLQNAIDRTSSMEWMPSGEKYCIISPKSKEDILNEAVQQSNCLASYVDPFLEGKTDIYFCRKQGDPETSFVTVEVRDGAIRQALMAFNRAPGEDVHVFLEKWCAEKGITSSKNTSVPYAV